MPDGFSGPTPRSARIAEILREVRALGLPNAEPTKTVRAVRSDITSDRIARILREVRDVEASCVGLGISKKPGGLDTTVKGDKMQTPDVGQTPWQSASEMAALRERRRLVGADCSVRGLAHESGSSRGRTAELLKMHDELSGAIAIMLGAGRHDVGLQILSRLSYRDLRAVLAIPRVNVLMRTIEIRRRLSRSEVFPGKSGGVR